MVLERIDEKVFDCHVHVGFCENSLLKRKKGVFISSEYVKNYLNRYHISRALIFPFPNGKADICKSNKYIIDSLEEESRLYGLLYFSFEEGMRSLTGFSHPRIVGVKVHPALSGVEASKIPSSLLKIVRDNNWFLLIDSSISEVGHPWNIIELAKKNKDIPIIIAHMARLFHREVLEVNFLDNLYLDISGICLLANDDYRLSPIDLRYTSLKKNISPRRILKYLEEFVGYERIMWGSDFPFPDFLGGAIKKEVDFILRESSLFIERKSLKKIVNDNLELLIKRTKL